MKPFTATEITTIFSGRVKMDKPQALPRSGHLDLVPGEPGTYEIRDFIVLKPGETVLIDPLPEKPEPDKPKKKKVTKK